MNMQMYDSAHVETFMQCFVDYAKTDPKFRYRLKVIAGEYYYEEMPFKEFQERLTLYPESPDKVLRC